MESLNYTIKCELCNKYYKSKNSLGNHNRRYHPKKSTLINQISTFDQPVINQISTFDQPKDEYKFRCKYCDKGYNINQSKWKHEKKCKENLKIINKKLEKDNDEIKKELHELKSQMEILINEKCKIHPKTLQKINNNMANNMTNIENQNNIQIIGFNKEHLVKMFSDKEMIKILKHRKQSLNELIKYAHFNDAYPELKNIRITNLKNNVAYIYDNILNKFVATTKNELITELIMSRMVDIDEFFGNVYEKLSEEAKKPIRELLDDFYKDEEMFTEKRKEYVKFLVFNHSN